MWVPRHVCGSKKGESPEQGRVLLIFQSREGVGMWALGCSGAASGNFLSFGRIKFPSTSPSLLLQYWPLSQRLSPPTCHPSP